MLDHTHHLLKARVDLAQSDWMGLIVSGSRGFRYISEAIEEDPYLYDAYMPIGTLEYFLCRSNSALQMIGKLFGLKSDCKEAVRKLELSSNNAEYSWVEAKNVLSYIYLYIERDYVKAYNVSNSLTQSFPGHPFFLYLEAESLIKLKDYEEYDHPGKNCLPLQEKSYETMEFLGDSILGSIVSSYLYERFYKIYDQNEGFLTYLKNRIVCGESLAHLSNRLGFNRYLIISKHIEDNCDGRNNKNILEDVFEAFIGAIYLDNDYDFTKNIILTIIEKYIDFTDIIIKNNNYKEQIIKYLQHNHKENPSFKTSIDENDDKVYNCIMYFKGDLISKGTGKSKKKAEQDSAKNGLIHFKVLTD